MIPTFIALRIYKGQTFNDALLFENPDTTPIDLTGRVCRMQIRMAIEDASPVIEFGTADGTITVDNVGNLTFNVPASVTATLPSDFDVASWVYDLQWTLPVTGVVERPIEGVILIFPEVTR